MANELEAVVDRIAEIIRRVGKREEVEEEVAENISFSEVANELLKVEGPVRDAAIAVVAKFLKGFEIESGSTIEETILENIDLKPLVVGLATDPEIQKALKAQVKGVIESLDGDDETFTEIVDEVFGVNDAKKMAEMLGDSDELKKLLAKKVQECIDGWDVDNLGDGVIEAIEKAAFTPEHIAASLASQEVDIHKSISDLVTRALENEDDDRLSDLVLGSEQLKKAIDSAIEALVRGGKIDRLVEQAVEHLLSKDNSGLQQKIRDVVAGGVVGRIADSVTERLFTRR